MFKFLKNNSNNILIAALVLLLVIVVANCVLSKNRREMFKAYKDNIRVMSNLLQSNNREYKEDYSKSMSERKEKHHKEIRRPELITMKDVNNQKTYQQSMEKNRYN